MKQKRQGFGWLAYSGFVLATLGTLLLCVCLGSVNIPLASTLAAILNTLRGIAVPEGVPRSIIMLVRLPRVLCVALTGASLSLCGAAMQGLLRNPLADGSTLGVSSGASLGAILAIAFGLTIPGMDYAGAMGMACCLPSCRWC